MQNQVLLQSRQREATHAFRGGVSLHGHTRHSQESLGFIGKFLQQRGLSRSWIEDKRSRCWRSTGIALDFERAYWTPPLCERRAYEVESRQIQGLGLEPMVSLSDHNSIEACVLLRDDPALPDLPISTEWTVPFGAAVFHLGVHNLPRHLAESLMEAMHKATAAADEKRTFELLADLAANPEVLLVFNHPLWNFMDISRERFNSELSRFLRSANQYLHAFEINGMRNHQENRGAVNLAEDWNQVVISGGDRHGCEPNAMLNLTNAGSFSEFVEEIRVGRRSTILIMPQYAEPLPWRFYLNFTHVVADYPHHPEGRRTWDERTFHPDREGNTVAIAKLWKEGPPEFLKAAFGAALMATHLPVRGMLRRWGNESELLRQPAAEGSRGTHSAVNAGVRLGFGESVPEPFLEDRLYRGGEPAAD